MRANIDIRHLEKELANQKGPMSIIKNPDAVKFVKHYAKFNQDNEIVFAVFIVCFSKYLDSFNNKYPYNKETIKFMLNK